jgi:hypothetical protein
MLTTEALQALRRHATVLPEIVRAQLVYDTGDGDGIRQQLGSLAHLPVLVQRVKVPGVEIRVPAGHVHQDLLHLRLGELEFLEEPPAPQIVVILVRLSQYVADPQVCFVVIRPVLLAAVHRYATVGTFEIDVGWWGACLGGLAGFEVPFVVRRARRLVRGMWAVCMLSHKGRALSYLGYRRVGERVEEGVFRQDPRPLDALRINIGIRLERLLKAPAKRCRERPLGQSDLWVRRSFGGMVPLGGNILDEGSEGLRRPQLRARALDERQTLSACVRGPHLGLSASNGEVWQLRQDGVIIESYLMPSRARTIMQPRWCWSHRRVRHLESLKYDIDVFQRKLYKSSYELFVLQI